MCSVLCLLNTKIEHKQNRYRVLGPIESTTYSIGTAGTANAFHKGMKPTVETVNPDIRVTVVSVQDGEIHQIFECFAGDISEPWFLEFLTDSMHPWRRLRVFVNAAGDGPSYGVSAV